jgi:hypothetical protein
MSRHSEGILHADFIPASEVGSEAEMPIAKVAMLSPYLFERPSDSLPSYQAPSTFTSSSNFPSIHALTEFALTEYAKQTGIDLTKYPFAEKFENCDSADSITRLLQERAMAFKEYRDGNRNLINCLGPLVQVLHTISNTLDEALVLVSHSESIYF